MILPIHLLASGDELEFGKEYVLLSKLHRLGFPVAEGFIVAPPHTVIKHFIIDQNLKSLRDFETKQGSFQSLLLNHLVETHTLSDVEKELLVLHWPEMVRRWMIQLHSHFTRFDGFSPKHLHLKSAPLLVLSDVIAQGSAQWEPFSEQVVIDLISGELDHGYLAYIDDLVLKMNQKLGFKYSYQFAVTSVGVKITHLEEIRHTLPTLDNQTSQIKPKSKTKRLIKLYSTFSGNLVLDENCDGYFLESDRFGSHDQKQIVLLETMIAKHPQIILYQISDRFIQSDAAAIKLCRNLKKRDNLELVFPFDEDFEQLLELKRKLSSLGVTRKGKLKFWIKIALPALSMQVDEVVKDDFDGVVFDVNFLAAALHGRDITEQGDPKDVAGLIRFLEPLMKKLEKKKIPVIFYGSLVADEALIKQAIKWHVDGLVVGLDTEQIGQQVAFHEQVVSFGLV